MKAYSVVAAAFAAFATGMMSDPIGGCMDDRCRGMTASAGAQPLQLNGQKQAGKTTIKRVAAKTDRRKRAKAKAAATPALAQDETPAVADNAADADTPLPVVLVRTTRETAGDDMQVVSADEFNDIDRAAASPSLVAFTIVSYLGGPAVIDDKGNAPEVNPGDFPAEARDAFAAAPAAPKTAEVALEYILMTFGGALAAASAIRLFAV